MLVFILDVCILDNAVKDIVIFYGRLDIFPEVFVNLQRSRSTGSLLYLI